MKKLIILLIILFIVGGGIFLFYKEGSLAVNKTDTSSTLFTVNQGETLDTIINNLSKEGLIRNRLVFYLVVKQMGIERKIQAGQFRLSPALNTYQIADALTHGTLDTWVVIREGLRKEEIAEIIAKQFNISETEFNQIAQEGYLFPDTYLIPSGASAQDIVNILRKRFDEKYNDDLKAKAKKNGLTDEEVVIIASMLEREAKFGDDREKIASVILRRYKEDHPLQLDATVQYALGYQPKEKRWWKKTTFYEDLKVDSPYNTYKNAGLPPAPISNPGQEALEAVVNANPNTPYFYYLSEPDGTTHFAKNLEEHERNIEKYLK
jgi:UPF0755 protein